MADVIEQVKSTLEGVQVFVVKGVENSTITVPSATALAGAVDIAASVEKAATTVVAKTKTAIVAKEVEVGVRGFPLAAVNKGDIIGEDFDPYDSEGEHAENFLVAGRVIYDGFCSTYREWHISVRGFTAGLRCKTFEDLPKAPTLWQDEGQYYETMAAVAYDLKAGSKGVIGGILALVLLKFGGITLPFL